MHEAKVYPLSLGPPRLVRDSHPDFEWILRGQVVKAKSRQEADDAPWHTAARFRETAMF
jgi:hypothetical protein